MHVATPRARRGGVSIGETRGVKAGAAPSAPLAAGDRAIGRGDAGIADPTKPLGLVGSLLQGATASAGAGASGGTGAASGGGGGDAAAASGARGSSEATAGGDASRGVAASSVRDSLAFVGKIGGLGLGLLRPPEKGSNATTTPPGTQGGSGTGGLLGSLGGGLGGLGPSTATAGLERRRVSVAVRAEVAGEGPPAGNRYGRNPRRVSVMLHHEVYGAQGSQPGLPPLECFSDSDTDDDIEVELDVKAGCTPRGSTGDGGVLPLMKKKRKDQPKRGARSHEEDGILAACEEADEDAQSTSSSGGGRAERRIEEASSLRSSLVEEMSMAEKLAQLSRSLHAMGVPGAGGSQVPPEPRKEKSRQQHKDKQPKYSKAMSGVCGDLAWLDGARHTQGPLGGDMFDALEDPSPPVLPSRSMPTRTTRGVGFDGCAGSILPPSSSSSFYGTVRPSKSGHGCPRVNSVQSENESVGHRSHRDSHNSHSGHEGHMRSGRHASGDASGHEEKHKHGKGNDHGGEGGGHEERHHRHGRSHDHGGESGGHKHGRGHDGHHEERHKHGRGGDHGDDHGNHHASEGGGQEEKHEHGRSNDREKDGHEEKHRHHEHKHHHSRGSHHHKHKHRHHHHGHSDKEKEARDEPPDVADVTGTPLARRIALAMPPKLPVST
eukprot:TRINITY_DN3170_c5_g1_i1.p1 TRINITY_DN3170_c5_g1~~TRINITY_DN3170_c5_g1_i1.p1  ORF type:complete len:662 (+),score=122.96 TRINITY_DN3170_c5_g1_i1:207-2192(+)